jgi:hypothetical protein
VPVTIDNYNRAQSDIYFALIAKGGGFGKFRHGRDLAPIGRGGSPPIYSNHCIGEPFSDFAFCSVRTLGVRPLTLKIPIPKPGLIGVSLSTVLSAYPHRNGSFVARLETA